jgi:hypothetical protein
MLPAAGTQADGRALAERGLRRILIEGGADTVSRFLAAGWPPLFDSRIC